MWMVNAHTLLKQLPKWPANGDHYVWDGISFFPDGIIVDFWDQGSKSSEILGSWITKNAWKSESLFNPHTPLRPCFTSNLNEMKVLFADSLPILKVQRDQPNSPLEAATNKLSDVCETLFSAKFDAHDALEDVKALRNDLFTPPL